MMINVSELLDRVSAQIGAKNDSALAKELGMAPGQITFYRQGKRSPDPDRLAQLYELAGLDPTEALLKKHAELSKGPARKYYETLLKSVATLCLAGFLGTQPTPAQAKAFHVISIDINYEINNVA